MTHQTVSFKIIFIEECLTAIFHSTYIKLFIKILSILENIFFHKLGDFVMRTLEFSRKDILPIKSYMTVCVSIQKPLLMSLTLIATQLIL